MNQEIKAAWIAKLRSGEIQQGRGVLRSREDKMCCLGVLCELGAEAGIVSREIHPDDDQYSYGENGMTGLLPLEIVQWAGTYETSPWVHIPETNEDYSLTQLNDTEKFNFSQIADAIEGDERI